MKFSFNKVTILISVAVILRLVLAATSFHPDIQAFDLGGQVVSAGHITDFYDYLSHLDKSDPLLKKYPADFFIYPPAVYALNGLYSFLVLNFINPDVRQSFLLDSSSTLGDWRLNLHLLLLKLPYLFFDFMSLWLLYRLFETKRDRMLVLILWLFNPVNLYVTYMMGQFDIIPTFFVILSLYLIIKHRRLFKMTPTSSAAVILGIGACFKIYPLFFLVPLASLTTSWLTRIKVLGYGMAIYLLGIVIYLPSKGFRTSALVSGLTLKSFYAQIPISGGEAIILFLAAIIFVYLVFFENPISQLFLWQRYLIIMLLFFIFTHYHPQWFLWISPLFIMAIVKSTKNTILAISFGLVSYFGLLFFFDPGLTTRIFAPLVPALNNAPTLWDLIRRPQDYNLSRSLLQTLFVGSAVYLIRYYFPRKDLQLEPLS